MSYVNDVLLGIIEGITEFLPISSTGHLLLAEQWLGARADAYNIVIQAGAILAVTLIYWRRLVGLIAGWGDPANRDYLLKLLTAFGITAVLGLVVKKLGFELPETVTPIAWALVLGGALGNLYDRIALGHVIDFILVHWQNRWYFPAFNFADSAICVGAVMLALDMFKSKKPEEPAHD
mgnify:CR=1 FL=1